MPFPDQTPRVYNRVNVEAVGPNQMGCYGLYRPNHWIYVGSGDIRQRLLDHLNGDNACITGQEPAHWVDTVTSDYVAVEKRLILELNPACNKRVG